MKLNLLKIQAAAQADRVIWKYHASQQAEERGISIDLAMKVIREGEFIEEYPTRKPYPACLMMAMVEPKVPLYVVLAYDEAKDYIHLITVHWIDPQKWKDPWTRRTKTPKLKEDQ